MPRKIQQNQCNKAIEKTLAYEAVFKFPFSYYQLCTFLITGKNFKKKDIDRELKNFTNKGYIKKKKNRYYLPGVKSIDWQKREKISKKIINKNLPYIKQIAKVPWVKMIAITGDLSLYSGTKDSDIDLLIISEKNRLWLTRGFVSTMLKILNKFPNKDGEAGKFCTNIYMDESRLTWPTRSQNLYVAHSIATMQPLINKDQTYERFLHSNKWASKYLSNFKTEYLNVGRPKKTKNKIINKLETLAYKTQKSYMKNKITNETIEKHLIHFNKNDCTKSTLSKYKKILKRRKIY